MRKMSFSCGDKIRFKGKKRMENGLVCRTVDTTDENEQVRILMEDGSVANKQAGNLTKR